MIAYLLNPADNRYYLGLGLFFAIFSPLLFLHSKLKSLQGPEQDSVHLRGDGTKEDLILYLINSSRLPKLTHPYIDVYKTLT